MVIFGQEAKHPRSGKGIPIGFAFTATIVLLVALAGGIVLMLAYDSAGKSIKQLVREKSEALTNSIVQQVESHLAPVRAQSLYTADLIQAKDVASLGEGQLGDLLSAVLAASPQVSSIALVDRNHQILRAFRNRPARDFLTSDWSDDRAFVEMLRPAWSAEEPYWGPLFYAEASWMTLLNFIAPVRDLKGERYVLLSSVSLGALSSFLASLETEATGRTFILFDRNAVLAHPLLIRTPEGLDDKNPLPLLEGFQDKTLAQIWSPERVEDLETGLANGQRARVVEVEGNPYVFLYRRLEGFGKRPWYVGSYFGIDEIAPQLGRNKASLLAGAIVIALGVGAALILGRMISRPLKKLALAAGHINHWELDGGKGLPKSLFKEVNEANDAFRSAIKGLNSLQMYLPRTLAHRLLEHGAPAEIQSEEHDITILFTDIVGFTKLAESMAPKDVVKLLNEHFALVAACIEAERGIVDKYIGDSAMAFWGGLRSDQDHARHACRAALRIAEAIYRENGKRRAEGKEPLYLCIGIHSGKAMLGNIGSPGRINYTVIGDSVNTAERLEILAREIEREGADVISLISGDTAMRLGQDFLVSPIGTKVLRGRHEETEVFLLKSSNNSVLSD